MRCPVCVTLLFSYPYIKTAFLAEILDTHCVTTTS